jgi:peptide/nickel transport system substrate-binding protein
VANLLTGTVELTLGTGIPIDTALDLRNTWKDGHFTFEFSDHRWFVVDPQFVDPNPPILSDLRFRRALLEAIDRQEMAETLQGGLSPIAHSFMAPNQPDYQSIEQRVPKYTFDPRRSAQTIEELGYQKGSDGIYAGPGNQKLEIELWASSTAVTKPMLSVAGYWQSVGVATVTSTVPPQRAQDWPWRAPYPGFQMFTGTNDIDGLPALYSYRSMLPSNNFQVSGIPNWPRYQSPELDGMLDRYFTAIPKDQRVQALTDINVHIAQNLNLMGLYYFPTPYAIGSRLMNIPENRASKASIAWNAEQWDVDVRTSSTSP